MGVDQKARPGAIANGGNGASGGHSLHGASAEAHAEAVNRSIRFMRQRLGESQELRNMAEVAFLSPFHFHRVFRAATGVPPGRFLTALRMATAKSLLLETELSATSVSTAVGYSSFGTFTTQFTRLVGVPPGRFRGLVARMGDLRAGDLVDVGLPSPPRGGVVRGWVSGRPDGSDGLTLVGMFTSSIPQERPLSCSLTTTGGPVELCCGQLNGSYAMLAMSVRRQASLRDVLVEDRSAGLYVGNHAGPVRIRPDGATDRFAIQLRPLRFTDPPVLGAFPLLLLAGQYDFRVAAQG